MRGSTSNNIPDIPLNQYRLCICCGIPLEKNKKKYCNKKCKEAFIFKLKWFNNLLRAITTRYASFFFTQDVLVLNILPISSIDVFSYFYKRTPGKRPLYDMEKMVFFLGDLWWKNLRYTGHRDGASRETLKKGNTSIFNKESITPKVKISIIGIYKELLYLKINKQEFISNKDQYSILKKAYKKSALKYHPDMGGNKESFMKIYNSYQRVLSWLKNPHYSKTHGLIGHWHFDGFSNKWYPPL